MWNEPWNRAFSDKIHRNIAKWNERKITYQLLTTEKLAWILWVLSLTARVRAFARSHNHNKFESLSLTSRQWMLKHIEFYMFALVFSMVFGLRLILSLHACSMWFVWKREIQKKKIGEKNIDLKVFKSQFQII